MTTRLPRTPIVPTTPALTAAVVTPGTAPGSVTGTIVDPTTPAGGSAVVIDPGGLRVAVRQFLAGARTLDAALAPYYVVMTAAERKRTARVPRGKEGYIPAMATLARSRPDLVPSALNTHTMDDTIAVVADLRECIDFLQGVLSRTQDTTRGEVGALWTQVRELYAIMQRAAPTNPDVASTIAPLGTSLKQGPRTATTQTAADRAAAVAQRAAERAAAKAQLAADKRKAAETRAAAAAASRVANASSRTRRAAAPAVTVPAPAPTPPHAGTP